MQQLQPVGFNYKMVVVKVMNYLFMIDYQWLHTSAAFSSVVFSPAIFVTVFDVDKKRWTRRIPWWNLIVEYSKVDHNDLKWPNIILQYMDQINHLVTIYFDCVPFRTRQAHISVYANLHCIHGQAEYLSIQKYPM